MNVTSGDPGRGLATHYCSELRVRGSRERAGLGGVVM